MSSTDRKRLRDRRAQQTLRDKKLRHPAKLEEQVAHCDQYHNDKGMQRLLEVISGLRAENNALLGRQGAAKSLVTSWDEGSEDAKASSLWMYQKRSCGGTDKSLNQWAPSDYRGSDVVASLAGSNFSSIIRPQHLNEYTTGARPDVNLDWNRLPLYSDDFSD